MTTARDGRWGRRLGRALVGLALATAALVSPAPVTAEDAPGGGVDPSLHPLRRWLEAEDPVLRAMAAFELRRHVAPGAIRLAREVLEGERDAVVTACALGSLLGRARVDLVAEGGALLPGLLIRLLEHEHPVLRDRAGEVLRALAGPRVEGGAGSDADDWRRWWLEARGALVDEQRRILGARPPGAPVIAPPRPGEGTTTPADRRPDLFVYVADLRRDGLEVCIVLDHTGSMAPVIGMARSRAASLVRRLAWLVPGFRAGLVTYDDQARLRIALTADGKALQAAFRKVRASGGGDWEEGVDKGVALALRQERLAWSRRAHRVLVVIGDAPPHLGDVAGLIRRIRRARDDELYTHPVIVNTVSTQPGGVDHFEAIATAGGGLHTTLGDAGRLEEELVALVFGAGFRDEVRLWLNEVEHVRRASPR